MEQLYQYCFIRTDLPEVQRIIQMAHATMEMGKRLPQQDSDPCNLILFEVDSEEALVKIACDLHISGYDHYMFDEPDRDDGFTAIACAPISGYRREYFKKFTLYGKPNFEIDM